ncbi:MAG: hypothetical protein LBE34_11410 [Flavobacteriaceae bacterium]|jgi:hypothetical protein|nr:hypothetical protein [Flavobacteriaceae bacterium]
MEKKFCDETNYPKIALVMTLVFMFILCYSLYVNYDNKIFFLLLLSVFIIIIIAAFWIYTTSLIINLSKKGIAYELKSFFTEKNFIPMEDIIQIELVSLDFTTRFGGWGKRKHKNEIAYIFNNNFFLEIKTLSQVYYFSISDNKKEECLKFIKNLNE